MDNAPPNSTAASPAAAIGIIGGSGLYELAGLEGVQEMTIETPFGRPSDPPLVGTLGGRRVIFLPRHGRGHRLSPSEIPYRANVHALKQLGAEWVLSVSAVGSMREEIRPGDLVLVDQLIDKTYGRQTTFFGDGCVGHVGFAEPVCGSFGSWLADAAVASGFAATRAGAPAPTASGARVHLGGTYVCMEGPQFSTRAESLLHRSWGVSVIGMTAAPEAKLCREAELCFSIMALATDYDCWRTEEEGVTATAVLEVLRANIANARRVVEGLLPRLPRERECPCAHAAAGAIMTAPDLIPPATRARLGQLYGRYLGS